MPVVSVLAVLLSICCWPGSSQAEEVSIPNYSITSKGDRAKLYQDFREQKKLLDKRLEEARLMIRLKMYERCIEICDEIMAMDSTNSEAKSLRNLASTKKFESDDSLLENESMHRDREVMRDVTKWGMAPRRKEDIPRPEMGKNIPFQQSKKDYNAVQEALGAKIEELNISNADLSYALQVLYSTTDLNIICSPEILEGKKITIQARNITVGDVLKFLANQGLHYTVSNGIIWLYSDDEEEGGGELFTPEVIQLRSSLTRFSAQNTSKSEKGPKAGSVSGSDIFAGSSGGDDEDGVGGEDGETKGDDKTHIEVLMKWMEKSWPGWPEGSTWMLDKKTNKLIVCSTPKIIQDVKDMVSMIDVETPQILITTVFVTIGETDYDQLGLQWTVAGNNQDVVNTDGTFKDGTNQPDKLTIIRENIFGTAAKQYTDDDPASSLTGGIYGVLNEHQFSLALDAINSKSSTRIMTAPRVIALNNHEALINITDRVPYVTDWETETAGTTTDTSSSSATTVVPADWDEEEVGFILNVTPSVGGDMRNIYLSIIPEITELKENISYNIAVTNSDSNDGDDGNDTGTSIVEVTRPVFSKKTIVSEAIVQDGHTVVIGGLVRDDHDNTNTKVPVLGDIPIINKLFKSRNKRRSRSYELIFVTARIITPDNRRYTDGDDETGDSGLHKDDSLYFDNR